MNCADKNSVYVFVFCMFEICVSVQFSDMLVYTSRIATSSLQFKVHGQLPLKGMAVSVSSSYFVTSVAELIDHKHTHPRCNGYFLSNLHQSVAH